MDRKTNALMQLLYNFKVTLTRLRILNNYNFKIPTKY